eukprot:GEMP01094939.1.p1 GENE.GEMP01094939.1~~GEMP01094939.1.p1  ORF type:complete len:185 (+),score=44.04 GEMP01094939.1:63-617(+)
MGSVLSAIWRRLDFLSLNACDYRILILGFPGVGKKDIIEKARLGTIENIMIGPLDVKEVKDCAIHFISWDLGEASSENNVQIALGQKYFNRCHGLIYVMMPDTPLLEARAALDCTLGEKGMWSLPLLVFINCTEMDMAVSIAAITDGLGLHSSHVRPWKICKFVSSTGDGLYEGMDWMARAIAA